MKRRNPYHPDSDRSADRIADLWQIIASELEGIAAYQKKISIGQNKLKQSIELIRDLTTNNRKESTADCSESIHEPGYKQKFGWSPNYRIDELYSLINGVLIETMPVQDFRSAFTGEVESNLLIKIQRRKVKEFADLIFHLDRKGVTLNNSLVHIIHARCLDKNGEIKKLNVEKYISLSRTSFSFTGEPLYALTSKILARLDRTKLSSD